MAKINKRTYQIIALAVVALVLSEMIPLADKIIKGRQISELAVPYQQIVSNPRFSILVVGDSSAVGTGADSPRDSIAGRLGQDYPQALIYNLAENGAVIEEVLDQFEMVQPGFDLIIVHAGGNDVLNFVPVSRIKANLDQLLRTSKTYGDTVVLFTTGNAAHSPFLPRTVRGIYGRRTLELRDTAMNLADKYNIIYVDIIGFEHTVEGQPYQHGFFSADNLHPSSHGYEVLYDWMIETLQENNINFYQQIPNEPN